MWEQLNQSAAIIRLHSKLVSQQVAALLKFTVLLWPSRVLARGRSRCEKVGHQAGFPALNPLPAHRLELLAERALDQIVFPLDFTHAV